MTPSPTPTIIAYGILAVILSPIIIPVTIVTHIRRKKETI